ncbi:sensor histidine kinase [Streptomyces griseofuscus]|uniref:sensor histidine kinase n=1 Tax=Streptomyces griseofuscus TaxID=146922 RepID=UPI00118825B5|nr:two-component sensor histidine kinase [Streptomyces rochei]
MVTDLKAAPRAARRWIACRPRLADAALGGGLTLFDVATVVHRAPEPAAWGVALWGAQTVPLLWRRTHPCLALAAMTVLYAAFQATSPIAGKVPGPFLLMLGVYALAGHVRARVSLPGTVLCLVSALTADALTGHWRQPPSLGSLEPISATTFVFFLGLAWASGYGRRRIGADADRLRDLNRRLAAEQERNARQAVVAERARIARDLHDVVAHHVSAIAVQARAAEDVLATGPLPDTTVVESVGLIARSADTALVEMRRLLGLLSFRDQRLAPEPSLDHLGPLLDTATAAGCRVTSRVTPGAQSAPSPGMRVSAYRIVQEALTNVVKHAGPVGVSVTVRGDASRLTVEVVNGPAAPDHQPVPGSGRGLMGMRERVAAFDGELTAGVCEGGGWRLYAVLRGRAPRAVEVGV